MPAALAAVSGSPVGLPCHHLLTDSCFSSFSWGHAPVLRGTPTSGRWPVLPQTLHQPQSFLCLCDWAFSEGRGGKESFLRHWEAQGESPSLCHGLLCVVRGVDLTTSRSFLLTRVVSSALGGVDDSCSGCLWSPDLSNPGQVPSPLGALCPLWSVGCSVPQAQGPWGMKCYLLSLRPAGVRCYWD